jgi:hypothetical protein
MVDKQFVTFVDEESPWWHPIVLLGFVIAFLCMAWLIVVVSAMRLYWLATGQD